MIPWLDPHDDFPPVEQALRDPNGLLCAGADLSPQRLLAAYRNGIFPWFSPGEPILWWSPDPRMVLFPDELRIPRSLRRRLQRGDFEIRLDSAFAAVIDACATTPRPGQAGTWITREMRAAYLTMHELGYAHSVECWRDDRLVGGLYGMALGKVFFGESMFSIDTDASKVALAHLVRFLRLKGYVMIDCQMKTAHLMSMGAREISRQQFRDTLDQHACTLQPLRRWPTESVADMDWT